MRLTNKRYMPYKVAGRKLKKGQSMDVTPKDITSRIQTLLAKGYFQLLEANTTVTVAKNTEPDENLPDTDPAPPVPVPKEEVKVSQEKAPKKEKKDVEVVASSADKPKISKRRRKKVSDTPEE